MNIKAIETRYAGYRFRSRMEARWAVFFDAAGLAYEYEKEGYDLGNAGRYLPDFWLSRPGCWVEIKPERPTAEERRKGCALCLHTRACVFFFVGVPRLHEYGLILAEGYEFAPSDAEELAMFAADPEEFGGALKVAQAARHRGWAFRNDPLTFGEALLCRADWQSAVEAARSARFEHGETPRPR